MRLETVPNKYSILSDYSILFVQTRFSRIEYFINIDSWESIVFGRIAHPYKLLKQ